MRLAVKTAIWITLAGFVWLTWEISLHKFYAADEFQYGHAAWLVSQGQTPFVDFFDHHFPLIYQLFAPIFLLEGGAVDYLEYMRLAMWPFIILCTFAFFLIRRSEKDDSALWATLFMFSCWPLMSRMTEFRPDTLAYVFVMLSLATLYSSLTPRIKGTISGFLLTLGVWSSQKVMVYGLPFVISFLIDLLHHFRKQEQFMLGNPYFFALGSILAMMTFPLLLFVNDGVITHWFYWCIQWPMEHEKMTSGFPWQKFFLPVLSHYFWLIPSFYFGIRVLLKGLLTERTFLYHPNLLLLSILPLTFISYAMQKAPYAYSLIPFLSTMCLFAGIGTVYLGQFLAKLPFSHRLNIFIKSLLIFILLALVIGQGLSFRKLAAKNNTYQKQMLQLSEQIMNTSDCVYDNSASTLIHPAVHFYYFTNYYIRKSKAHQLTEEIPAAIQEKGCTFYFHDGRFSQLPKSLQQYVKKHFWPYQGELWVYGQHFKAVKGPQTFDAVRSGLYFITPQTAIENLIVDGKLLESQIFYLEKGSYQVTYPRGEPIFILWLPADGKVFLPKSRGGAPFFLL